MVRLASSRCCRPDSTYAPATLLNYIMSDLDRFVANAPQHDDVTLMLLRAS